MRLIFARGAAGRWWTMTSATDCLREMLDELGVKHRDYNKATEWIGAHGENITAYTTGGTGSNSMVVKHYTLTPEQAIAATLGSEPNPDGLPVGLTISEDGNLLNWRGENYVRQNSMDGGALTAEQVRGFLERHSMFDDATWTHGTQELVFVEDELQAMADELNAALGAQSKLHSKTGGASSDGGGVFTDDALGAGECERSAHPKACKQWTTVLLPEIAWPSDGSWPDYLSVAHDVDGEWRVYVPEAAPGAGECKQVLSDCDDGLMPPFTAHCSECGAEWGFTPKYCHNCGARVTGTRDERKAVKR